MEELRICLQDSPVWQWRDTSSTAGAVLSNLMDYFTDLDLSDYVVLRDLDRMKQIRPHTGILPMSCSLPQLRPFRPQPSRTTEETRSARGTKVTMVGIE